MVEKQQAQERQECGGQAIECDFHPKFNGVGGPKECLANILELVTTWPLQTARTLIPAAQAAAANGKNIMRSIVSCAKELMIFT